MAPRSSPRHLTRRLLTIQRTLAPPEIAFRRTGSILGTPLPSEISLSTLDIISPEQCSPEVCEAIQHLLDTSIPQWRWVSSPTRKLQKPGRTQFYQRAWTKLWKREIGLGENVLVMVEREPLESVDAASDRAFSELELEERLRGAGRTSRWKLPKALRLKLWKRPLNTESESRRRS